MEYKAIKILRSQLLQRNKKCIHILAIKVIGPICQL